MLMKNHGDMWLALSWSCRVGVGRCEFGFTVIDVSSSSLGEYMGRVEESRVEGRAQERGDETSTVCMCVCDLTA